MTPMLLLASLLAADPVQQTPASEGLSGAQGKEAVQKSEDRKKLEEEIARELGAGSGTQATPQQAGPPGAGASSQAGGNPFARLLMLPDISAIGDFAAAYNSYDAASLSPRGAADPTSPAHKIVPLFQELELGLQSVVDPYVRADVFLSSTRKAPAWKKRTSARCRCPPACSFAADSFTVRSAD